MTDFTHLHVHSEYSLLDGQSRLSRLVSSAAQRGMTALAITDHGSMYGAIPFYEACKAQGLNPIQGVEAYLSRDMREKGEKRFEYNHLLLLAMNQQGYQNLLTLVTLSHTEGYYQRPRIDKPTLAKYSEGLIVTSGCLAGEIPQYFLSGQDDKAYEAAQWYIEVFGRDRFYIEVQNHLAGGDQDIVNPKAIELARRLNLRLLATNDLHYVERRDAHVQDAMLCVQTGAKLADEDRMRFDGPEYYLKSADEMAAAFTGLEDALTNTMRVADMCHVDIEFGRNLLPQYDVPTGETQRAYLVRLIEAGMVERYGVDWRERTISGVNLRDRLNYEFGIIETKGFIPYFLIVWDYVNYARSRDMRCVARGSVAGSIVAYSLGISNVDPLFYGLLFERFLNPERNSMPDIDMDFPDDRREEVIRYVANKYGWDKVAQIVTMSVMQAKTAVRDVGRILGDYQTSDRISRLMPNGSHLEVELRTNEDLQRLYTSDHQARTIIDLARHLDGTIRSDGVHAAGVVISSVPLVEVTPCQHLKKQRGIVYEEQSQDNRWLVTQFQQNELEKLGLLKMDFLGLSNLTILQRTAALVKEHYGIELDLERLPADDAKVFEMLSRGDTTGVFQLESPPMRAYIRELKPTSVSDIMAMVALYRPGPMDSIQRFIRAKHGQIPITYPHPDVEDILRSSYGVIVYQDQVLLVARKLAGLSWGQVDKLRKAIGKKIATGPDGLPAQKKKFIDGCVSNGISQEKAEEIFSYIEPFAGYGFNAAHACAYAWVAYQTAWLKVHYPEAFMAASLSKEAGDDAKVFHLIAECRRMGVAILRPSINASQAGFTLERQPAGDFAIRFGLSAIKSLGEKQCAGIIAERAANGKFRSLPEVFARVEGRSFTKKTAETMIKAGALAELGERTALLSSLERAMKLGKKYRGFIGSDTLSGPHPLNEFTLDETEPTPTKTKLTWEREATGVYLSGSPLDEYGAELLERADTRSVDVTIEMEHRTVTVAGVIADVTKRKTQRGDMMANFTLEDLDGVVEVVIFPSKYVEYQRMLGKGNPLIVKGKVQSRNFGQESLQVIAEEITFYSRETAARREAASSGKAAHAICFPSQGGAKDLTISKQIAAVLASHPGDEAWTIYRVMPNGAKMRLLSSGAELGTSLPSNFTENLWDALSVSVTIGEEAAS